MDTQPMPNRTLDGALRDVEERYTQRNPASHARYQRATAAMPGGNTRTVLFYDPFPLTLARGAGCRLWDIDGHEYIDFVCEQSAALYGHSNPVIQAAAEKALRDGIVLGGPNQYDVELAEQVKLRFPSVDTLRFCNSGTEANLLALVTARAVTGRQKVMFFQGGYHGGVLSFPSGPAPINVPIPAVMATYNDVEATAALIAANAGELAAIILEPMMGGAGCIPATREFLQMLRDQADAHGIVLIFDEVMTSRCSWGGIQAIHGIRPDLTSFGKYLGGGFAFGAFGGKAELMARFDPRRPDHFNHPGTYNNAVCTMAAGLAGLTQVLTPDASRRLNAMGDLLRDRLNQVAQARGVAMQATGMGSLVNIHFASWPIRNAGDAARGNMPLRKLLHLELLTQDIYTSRRGFLPLSIPVGEAEVERLVGAVDAFLDRYGDLAA